MISCGITLKAPKPSLKQYPARSTTVGDHLKKKRLDLDLSQPETARRLGVSDCTLRNWEKSHYSPKTKYLPEIIKFLGYTPWQTSSRTLRERILKKREQLGLSQKQLALRIGVSPDTIADWESGQTKPSPWLLRTLAAYFAHGGRPIIGQQTFEANKLLFSERLKLFLGRHLKRRRQSLGLTQSQLAERLDTTIWAVRGWEENRYIPKVHHIRRIIEFLGYVPEEIQPRTPADQMKLSRGILGLEQKELADLLGVADTSISRWENGKYPPPDEFLEKLKLLTSTEELIR